MNAAEQCGKKFCGSRCGCDYATRFGAIQYPVTCVSSTPPQIHCTYSHLHEGDTKVADLNMVTTSPKDKKAARQTTKDFERLLNQTQKEVDKILMALKKENQREKLLRERSSLLARMLEMMRDRGASDQTLRKALPGLDEFANIISRTGGIAASNQPEHPQPAPTPTEEVLGLLLSEVKTQEIHWLWEKRIPRCYRGKYTSLNHPSSLQHSRYNTAKPSDTTETTETSDTLDTSDTTDTSITFLPLHYAGSV